LAEKSDRLHLTADEGAAWQGLLRAHATIMRALNHQPPDTQVGNRIQPLHLFQRSRTHLQM